MAQQLVLETTKEGFDTAIEGLTDEGYKIITGSLYVKSIATSVTEDLSGISEQQIHPFFAVTVEDWFGRNKLIHESDPEEFKSVVNEKIDEEFEVIVGSTYVTNEKTNGFPKKFKCMKTFYMCFMSLE
jgi:hypothetical protein